MDSPTVVEETESGHLRQSPRNKCRYAGKHRSPGEGVDEAADKRHSARHQGHL